ncbi:hypothetical protein GmHk_07G019035 [Glycine max]|nr:hypothetical protein GmHk_07G019035 [Glycine max]
MVRTRGLGYALARVIGRGRQDEHDAVDVPWRRRPTASVRRQRVHIAVDEGVSQVTEDVPHMAKDVPQMTEDVPHMADDVPQMSEDAPQMTADVDATVAEDLGRNGAKGSHADEGFPGGPRDPSVLTSFAEHVADAIWTGQERPELKLVSHGRKVALIGRPVPKIEAGCRHKIKSIDRVLSCNRRSWTYIRICGEEAQRDQHLPPSSRRVDDHTR